MNSDHVVQEQKAVVEFVDQQLLKGMEQHGVMTQKDFKDNIEEKRIIPIEDELKKVCAEIDRLNKDFPTVVGEYLQEHMKEYTDQNTDFSKGGDAAVIAAKEQEIAEKRHTDFIKQIKSMIDAQGGQFKFTFSMDHLDRGLFFSKTGIDVASSVPGASVAGGRPFFVMKQGNPIRQYMDTQQTTEGSVTAPKLAAITPAAETSVPDIPIAKGNYAGADPTSTTHALKPYPVRYPVSEKALMHIPTLQNRVLMLILNAIAGAQGAETAATMGGATGVQVVKTGVAKKFPTSENIAGRLNAMIEKIPPQYRMSPNCVFQMGTAVDGLLRTAVAATAAAQYAFNQKEGISTFGGFPWVVNDHFSGDGADAAVTGMFGNWFDGGIIYEDPQVEVRMYYETSPGQIVFFTNPAWVTAPQEVTKALVTFTVGA